MSKGFSVFTAFKAKDGLTPAFKSMTKGSNTLQNNVNRASMRLKGFGSCVQATCKKMNMLANVFITGFVFGKLKDYAKTTTDAAELQLAAEAKLTQVLKNNAAIRAKGTTAYLKISKELFDFASEIQQKGIIGDEVLIGGMQGLGAMGFDDKVIRKMTPIIADLAVQQKGYNVQISDTEQIAKQLGRALAGNAGGLSRMGVVLSSTQQKQIKNMKPLQRANYLYELLSKRVGGLNEKFAQTDRGAKIQALNNLGDRLEDIGKKIIPIEGKFWRLVNKSMPQISFVIDKFFKGISYMIDGFKPVLNELQITFKIFTNEIGANFNGLGPIFKNVFDDILIPALVVTIGAFNKLLTGIMAVCKFISDYWIPIVSVMAGVGGMLALKQAFDVVSGAIAWYNTVLMVSTAQGIAALSGFAKLKFMLTSYVGVIWASVKAIAAQTAALLMNPWTWVAIGIAAVVAGAILVWKNWDKITAALKTFWAKCVEVFTAFKTFFQNNFLDILLIALGPIGMIIEGIIKIGGAIRGVKKNADGANVPAANSPRIKNPSANYNQGKNGKFSGSIDVGVTIDNKTAFPATNSLNLSGDHGLNLSPSYP